MSAELARVEFNSDQVALIKRTICQGASDDELTLFLAQCKRTGLDPFARQIHAVKRFDKKQNREVMSIQIGIDGFRLIGDRTGLYDGQEGPFWCGADGVWRDVWISGEYPSAAKVLVYRKGCARAFVGIAHWDEYAQTYKDGNPLPMWAQMPAGQLAKCAESLALRKAFPQELSGLYSPEEMSQSDAAEVKQPEVKPAPQKHDPAALADKYAEHIRGAESLTVLKSYVEDMNAAVERKLLGKPETDRLIPLVTARKAELSAAAPAAKEGEQSADPSPAATTTSASAPSATTTTAAPATAAATPAASATAKPSTASSTEPAKPMPAAERRTAPPADADGIPKAGPAIVTVLLELMHKLELTWTEIRDRSSPKGKEIAEAAALPKLPAGARVNQMSGQEALRLRAELERRVKEKEERAARRAMNKAEREKELAAEQEVGSAS